MILSTRLRSGGSVLALAIATLVVPRLPWSAVAQESVKPAALPAAPKVGDPAPAFRLNDEHGKAVELGKGSKAGWTLLAFYPKAATPG